MHDARCRMRSVSAGNTASVGAGDLSGCQHGMSDEFPYDVFLSHSAKDKEVVRPLAERLRKDGVKVWFDEWEIRPGDSEAAKIEEGQERSRVLVHSHVRECARLRLGTVGVGDVSVSRPRRTRSAGSFLCASTTPPPKAPWRNSFTSTGSRPRASRKG